MDAAFASLSDWDATPASLDFIPSISPSPISCPSFLVLFEGEAVCAIFSALVKLFSTVAGRVSIVPRTSDVFLASTFPYFALLAFGPRVPASAVARRLLIGIRSSCLIDVLSAVIVCFAVCITDLKSGINESTSFLTSSSNLKNTSSVNGSGIFFVEFFLFHA